MKTEFYVPRHFIKNNEPIKILTIFAYRNNLKECAFKKTVNELLSYIKPKGGGKVENPIPLFWIIFSILQYLTSDVIFL